MCWFKCITGLVFENPLAMNVLPSVKNLWNLQKSTFMQLFHHSESNWAKRSYFQLDLRFKNCLITRWLPTTSILVVIERIYRYQFKSNYLKKINFLRYFYLIFRIDIKFWMFWRKMTLRVQVFLNILTPENVLI